MHTDILYIIYYTIPALHISGAICTRNMQRLSISLLLWENMLCLPLHCLLPFCLSFHPFQFLPEVCRRYNDGLFLSPFPDRAIAWRRNRSGMLSVCRGRQCRDVNSVFCRTNTITDIHCWPEVIMKDIICLHGRYVPVDTVFLNSVTGLYRASFNKSPNISFVILCPVGWWTKFLQASFENW
jgi:hypothetical protein